MISSPDSSELAPQTSQPEIREAREESPLFKEFSEKLALFPTPEEKVAHGLQFMRASISQEGSPRFREFWEARRLILPFFKENLGSAIRSKLWAEYVELTVEARRLKEILEEQSAFAMEQIDLAIKALEGDVENFPALLATTGELSFNQGSEIVRHKAAVYNGIQRELNLLNTLASRLNGLRKEIIKTDMRIRFKTKLFKRLSDLGDKIFPKRKELIEAVSTEFEKDIDHFIASHFQGEEIVGAPYYALREEIKGLQCMAKLFTLNSGVFTRTRLKLSECWDKVKVLEKERKKEVLEKKQASSEQRQGIQVQIDALKETCAEMPLADLNVKIEEISNEMRSVQLHRDDVRSLRDDLNQLRAPHLAAQEQKAKELEEAEKEKLRIKREMIVALKEKIADLSKTGDAMELEALVAAFDEVQAQITALEISKMEKQQIERLLRPLKDLVADKKEQSLVNLSEDDKKTLENLRVVLKQRKERRQEVKAQVEIYRKSLGGSNLDFEKAMQFQELLEQEKERLEKANAGIEEIEQKISDLES
ncbi:MAG: hypothetical protein COT85_00775 [Chlamydiae bacterium CG10_big_fil_rev_8_21_14_0_10_42_34]|nr:MAG: hypothetical protein COT85_00775 [Chlamydiae bacterium CG10_big_fil_rev_8_21_14_0_10_42_34]